MGAIAFPARFGGWMGAKDIPNWQLGIVSMLLFIIAAFAGVWAQGISDNQTRIESKVDESSAERSQIKERLRGVETEVRDMHRDIEGVSKSIGEVRDLLRVQEYERRGFQRPAP